MHQSTFLSFPSWHNSQQLLSREIDLEERAHHIIDLPVNIEDIILRCTTTTEDPDALDVDPELERFLSKINDSRDHSFQSGSLGEVGTEWEDSLLVTPSYSYKLVECFLSSFIWRRLSNHPTAVLVMGRQGLRPRSLQEKHGQLATPRSARRRDRKNWQSINGQNQRECQRSDGQKARDQARQHRRRHRM